MKGIIAGVGAAVLIVPLTVVVLLGSGGDCASAGSAAPGANATAASSQSVAGYSGDQLTNAAAIMNAATALKLDSKAQVIGVMTAMGESTLKNINYGDNAVNPDGTIADSIGLFQQQHWWGTVQQRMDPTYAATKFFQKLETIKGWEDLTPTIAAHRVQGNADPNYYTKFYAPAVAVVSALGGQDLSTDTGSGACSVGASGNYAAAAGTAPGPWGGYSNGKIPTSALAPIPWTAGQSWIGTMYLRPDALTALEQMDNAFKAQYGYDLPINDAYRSYDRQVQDKSQYGGEAATPGTSNHGWALAVDFGTQAHNTIAYNDTTYDWLKANAATYGWVHPAWAEPGGAGPHEAWHWEFYGVKK